MKLGKYPKLKIYTMALGFFAGSLLNQHGNLSFAQSRKKVRSAIAVPKEGRIGLNIECVRDLLHHYYILEEHWDGSNVPKIIAYYESGEMWGNNEPSYFAVRNEDRFTYTLFSMPDTRCGRCHQAPKVRDYLFLKSNQKPS